MEATTDDVRLLISQILDASKRLSAITERPFTPDGHLVGSMGEVYAKMHYGLKLHKPSHKAHDGSWNGREVQVKATQRGSVDLKGPSDLLLVLKITPDGRFEEVYNGDGRRAWDSLANKKESRAGEKSVSLPQLKRLNSSVDDKDRIPRML